MGPWCFWIKSNNRWRYLVGLLKDLSIFLWTQRSQWRFAEGARGGKYRALQITTEAGRLVAKEQRPTGLGGLFLLSRCRCAAVVTCAHLSHNPAVRETHRCLIKHQRNWHFCNCRIKGIFFFRKGSFTARPLQAQYRLDFFLQKRGPVRTLGED